MPLSTWTLNSSSDTSYDVIYVSNELTTFETANTNASYNVVIYIDGNELYTTGKGTSNDPYVIGKLK